MSRGGPTGEPRRETSDVPAMVPFYTGVVTLVLMIVSAIVAWVLLTTVWSGPATPLPFEPGAAARMPATEVAPLNDLDIEARHEQWLHSFGWIDRDANIVHIPIDRAMDLMVKSGEGGGPPPD